MKKRLTIIALMSICSVLAINITPANTHTTKLIITMPEDKNLQNINNNYYKIWLEEQTGLELEFNFVSEAYSSDYVLNLLLNNEIKTDIFLFYGGTNSKTLLSNEQIDILTENDKFLSLDEYITDDTVLGNIFSEYSQYNLDKLLTYSDDNIYYFPKFEPSRVSKNAQTMWINIDWLKTLNMSIPTTTDELYDVLQAFKTMDPNKNGIADEIPLVSAVDDTAVNSYNFLANAFIDTDPLQSNFFMHEGEVLFAPTTQSWREALIYSNKLYSNGLLESFNNTLTTDDLSSLATDPNDLIGCFTCHKLEDVMANNSPEIYSLFAQVPPLNGQNATIKTPDLYIGGAISSNTTLPDEAFKLLDFMMSEQAFLVSKFGEPDTDWTYAKKTDTDVFSDIATITILNNLTDTYQNKTFNEIGIGFSYPEYIDSISWKGFDLEYFDARACLQYEKYYPIEHINTTLLEIRKDDEIDKQVLTIIDYTDRWTQYFINGKKDINNDEDYDEYIKGFEHLGLSKLTKLLNEKVQE